jgi:hypothetical protein
MERPMRLSPGPAYQGRQRQEDRSTGWEPWNSGRSGGNPGWGERNYCRQNDVAEQQGNRKAIWIPYESIVVLLLFIGMN